VLSGLNPGDRVIVEGVQRAQPGATVNPVPAGSTTPPPQGAPQQGGGGH
jgi:membrane fusion protein (multidrug efflux system)